VHDQHAALDQVRQGHPTEHLAEKSREKLVARGFGAKLLVESVSGVHRGTLVIAAYDGNGVSREIHIFLSPIDEDLIRPGEDEEEEVEDAFQRHRPLVDNVAVEEVQIRRGRRA